MSSTSEGGKKGAATTKRRHGKDFFKKMGAIGGKAQTPYKGFGSKNIGADGLTNVQRAQKRRTELQRMGGRKRKVGVT